MSTNPLSPPGFAAALALSLCAADAAAAPPVTAVEFAPGGRSVVVGSQSGIEVRSWPGLRPLRRIETALAHTHDLAFSPDGTRLAASGGSPGESGVVEIFDWPGGKSLRRLRGHEDVAFAVAWDPGSGSLATAGLDRIVLLWDPDSGKVVRRFEGHSRGVTAVSFLPGGTDLLSAGIDQSLRVWDLRNGGLRRSLDNHTLPVHDLAVRPGGDGPPMVASVAEDRTVRFWQPTIGRLVRFARLESAPLAADWLPDGSRAAVACADGRVRLIDPDTATVTGDFPALDGWAYSLAVHPSGAAAVVGGGDGRVKRVPLRRE
ncbi:MAG TPA: WD40 repeat domain-containing protein [Gemmataceae bacterium]